MEQNTANLPGNNFRYERKFFISNADRNFVEKKVLMHPAFFSEIFHERYVNNIYYDFVTLNNFFDNIDGNMYRTKYRIRWYGDMLKLIKKSKLEIKIKKGFVGTKITFKLCEFKVNNGIINYEFKNVIRDSEIDPVTKFSLKEQVPVLLNRYRRKYYATKDNKFRITIDDNQAFYKINTLNNTFLCNHTDTDNIILELKYDKEYESLASEITNKLPFRLTKSSKYSRGIQMLYY
jgi:hypothetical protein